ncbi:MAG: hypothetical protein DRQ55_05735 [Planctomycetota bacterium]|nr:MAG: hypothetical protein DRQ55_05735 [Planctomycetota bacterium]
MPTDGTSPPRPSQHARAEQPSGQAPAAGEPPPRLSTGAFLAALSLTLLLFATLNPIWESADVVAWTENVWWSYVPIPLLVAALLLREAKLTRSSFALECLRLTFAKFALTFLVANTIWAVRGPPSVADLGQQLPRPGSGAGLHDPTTPPARPRHAPLETGGLSGVVRDLAGSPLAGAWVYVSHGLEGLKLPAPEQPLRMRIDGGGFSPSLALISAWQPLELRSADGELHTAVLAGPEQGFVLNRPVLQESTTKVMFRRAQGLLELSCSVHAGQEPGARLLVLGHGFFTRSDAEGRFSLSGVPARRLGVSALTAEDATLAATVHVTLAAGQELELPALALTPRTPSPPADDDAGG